VAGAAGEPRCPRRSAGPVDRGCAPAASAAGHRAGHGFERIPSSASPCRAVSAKSRPAASAPARLAAGSARLSGSAARRRSTSRAHGCRAASSPCRRIPPGQNSLPLHRPAPVPSNQPDFTPGRRRKPGLSRLIQGAAGKRRYRLLFRYVMRSRPVAIFATAYSVRHQLIRQEVEAAAKVRLLVWRAKAGPGDRRRDLSGMLRLSKAERIFRAENSLRYCKIPADSKALPIKTYGPTQR